MRLSVRRGCLACSRSYGFQISRTPSLLHCPWPRAIPYILPVAMRHPLYTARGHAPFPPSPHFPSCHVSGTSPRPARSLSPPTRKPKPASLATPSYSASHTPSSTMPRLTTSRNSSKRRQLYVQHRLEAHPCTRHLPTSPAFSRLLHPCIRRISTDRAWSPPVRTVTGLVDLLHPPWRFPLL